MKDYVVGLDISSSKVCGIVANLDRENKIQILGVTTSDYNDINDNVIVDEKYISHIVSNVIKRLEDIVSSPLEYVYLSVPISLCEVVKTKGVISFPTIKEITKEDIVNVCEVAKFGVSKNQEIVQVDIEEYIVDGMKNISNPFGMKSMILESEGNAFILESKYVNEYKKCLEETGMKVKGWVVNSIGIAKDVVKEDELDKGVAIIDIGNSNTEVTVFKNNKFLDFFSVPLGGGNITNDISICLKLSRKDSERLKFKCNSLLKENSMENHRIKVNTNENNIVDVNSEVVIDIIYERIKELLEIISSNIEKKHLNNEIESFVIVGGGISLFRDITVVSSELLGKPTRVGVPNYVGAANPIYSTATGIIRDVLKQQQNFNSDESLYDNINVEANGKKIVKNTNKFIAKIKGILKGFSNEEVIK
ncbi:MAG: cell division protein FtsA [Clostridium sp.]|uniref:cell division protein FtsA n=1 Tax=Clostridium sp. TaxID=1506 RepID=UPI00305F930A